MIRPMNECEKRDLNDFVKRGQFHNTNIRKYIMKIRFLNISEYNALYHLNNKHEAG